MKTVLNLEDGSVDIVALGDDDQYSATKRSSTLLRIRALEASITDRMWREDALGLVRVDPRTGRTASQQIAWVDEEIAKLRSDM